MMRVVKIVPPGNTTIEDATNEFFKQEQLSRSDIVHIRPIHMNTHGGLNDIVAVYVFYDKYDAVEQAVQ